MLDAELRQQLRDVNTLLFSVLLPLFLLPGLLWGFGQVDSLSEGWEERTRPRVAAPAALAERLPAEVERVEPGEPADAELVPTAEGLDVRYRSAAPVSVIAERRLMEALDPPWPVESIDVAPEKEALVSVLARSLPAVLLTLAAMASLYPAVEAMVADRERNVLETVLVTAAPRWVFVAGKLASVAIITQVSMLATLVGTLISLFHLAVLAETPLGVPPGRVLLVLPLSSLAALAAAAASLLAAAPAQNFKQAQNTASVAMVLLMGLAMLAMLPDASLRAPFGYVPITNAVLCIRELLLGHALGGWGWVAVGQLLLMVGGAGGVAARSLGQRVRS